MTGQHQTEKSRIEGCPKCGSQTPIGHRCIVDDLDAIRDADLSGHPLTQAIKNAAPKSEPQAESGDLSAILSKARVRLWSCPIDEHSRRRNERGMPVVTVEWIDGVAHCTAPDCDLTSENVRIARCTNYREDLDRPCTGGLFFKPGDIQARCFECGAWCGSQVADYISSPTAPSSPEEGA